MERAMLIGIAGPKRSGKDTLARGLCAALGLSQDSFAGPLRAFVANTLGMTLAELEDAKEAPIAWLDGITPRHLMQTVGTAARVPRTTAGRGRGDLGRAIPERG
jgi:hypothetical protein